MYTVRLLCPLLLAADFVAFGSVVCFFVDLALLLLLPVVPVRPSVVWLSPLASKRLIQNMASHIT